MPETGVGAGAVASVTGEAKKGLCHRLDQGGILGLGLWLGLGSGSELSPGLKLGFYMGLILEPGQGYGAD